MALRQTSRALHRAARQRCSSKDNGILLSATPTVPKVPPPFTTASPGRIIIQSMSSMEFLPIQTIAHTSHRHVFSIHTHTQTFTITHKYSDTVTHTVTYTVNSLPHFLYTCIHTHADTLTLKHTLASRPHTHAAESQLGASFLWFLTAHEAILVWTASPECEKPEGRDCPVITETGQHSLSMSVSCAFNMRGLLCSCPAC